MTVDEKNGEDVLPRCFFDVEIGGVGVGRVIMELFSNKCPKTCDNFRQLCTGEGGLGTTTEKPLHYKNSVFHRVIKDFMIQGGDFSNSNGTGGESVYGGTFEDEDLTGKHDEPFLLSMANRGPNTNGSQFFILTQPAPHLNGVHVVFGKIVVGQAIIKQIEGLPVDRKSRPLSDVRVVNCGELVLLKKKKEKKPKKEKKIEKPEVSDEEKEKSERSSGEITDSESEDEREKKKRKKSPSESKVPDEDDDNQEVAHPLVTLRSIDPEEIPKDPFNRLMRGKVEEENDDKKEKSDDKADTKKSRRSRSHSRNRSRERDRDRKDRDRGDRDKERERERPSRFSSRPMDNEGRKIKGRGRVCAPRFSRSRSKTPPHWKAESRRKISMKEYEEREKKKRERDDELRKRQEDRKKRHEEEQKAETEKEKERGKERERDRDRKLEKEKDRESRDSHRGYSTSLRDRFRSSELEDSAFVARDLEAEADEGSPISKMDEESAKIVEELTSKLQAAGDGVVYYQHLYKSNVTTSAVSGTTNDINKEIEDVLQTSNIPPIRIPTPTASVEFTEIEEKEKEKEQPSVTASFASSYPGSAPIAAPAAVDEEEDCEDEGPPGEEDENVLAELRMRKELLKKRLKEWEESSDDGEKDESKCKDDESKAVHSAMVTELNQLNQRDPIGSGGDEQNDVVAAVEGKGSKTKSRSRSKSKSRSRSKSRKRDRRRSRSRSRSKDRNKRRRHSSRGKDRSRSKSRDRRDRRRRDSSRGKDRKDRDRDRDRHRRSRKSRSRSRSRGRR